MHDCSVKNRSIIIRTKDKCNLFSNVTDTSYDDMFFYVHQVEKKTAFPMSSIDYIEITETEVEKPYGSTTQDWLKDYDYSVPQTTDISKDNAYHYPPPKFTCGTSYVGVKTTPTTAE